MAEQKTKPTRVSVRTFLNRITEEQRRRDAFELLKVMQEITGKPPKMWGPTIVGFGQYHYVYPSGHEGDACLAAFSPRKPDLVVYLAPGLLGDAAIAGLLKKLGKRKASKGCLYIRRLEDIHMPTLKLLIRRSVAHVKKLYG